MSGQPSGKRAGKTSISKQGNSHIRRMLYMPAFNVVRWEEPIFKALYDRLIARGKTKMQAYVAVQKKILVLMYTLWKKQQAYQSNINQTASSATRECLGVTEQVPLKQVAPIKARATQDKLARNQVSAVFFQLEQRY